MTAATRPWSERPDPDAISPHRPAWMQQAACYGLNDDTFYPPHGLRGKARDRWIADAITICLRCPVLEQCRAESQRETWGVWGGQWIEPGRARDNGHRATRACRNCNGQFIPDHGGTRYCGDECRAAANRRRQRVAA